MSLGKRLFIGEAAAAATSETADIFGDSSGIALYTLDYDASDESGNYDGTPSNVTFGVDGEINWGASFNGSSSYVNVTHNSSFNWTGNKSLSLWFKFDSLGSNVGIASKTGNNLGDLGWLLTLNGTTNKVSFNSYSSSDAVSSLLYDTVIVAGTWYHICVTGDGTTNKLYINGTEEDSASAVTGNNLTQNLVFGRYYSNIDNYYLDGYIDQVRFFTKALSSNEVSTLYAETATVHTATTDTLNYQGTNLAYYKLDNNALDETGNYDGTESNITYEFGRYGTAAVFIGSYSYIDTNLQMPSTTTFTFSCWFYKNDSANYHLIGDFNTTATLSSGRFRVQIASDGSISVGVGNGTSMDFSAFTPTVSLIKIWRHIAVTVDGTSVKAYIDGSQVGTTDTSLFSLASGVNNFAIGAYNISSGKQNFNGRIDQVRIYNSALDSTAVANLYNEKQAYITKNASNPFGDGDEEAFYKFDNNTNDSTGSYNMTNRNITFSTDDSAIGTHSGEFNGASSEGIISSTTTTPIDFSAEDFTISFWAKVDNFTNTVYPLSKWGSNATNDRAILTSIRQTGYEDFSVYEHNGSTYFQMTHSKSLEADRWYHFAYTRNGSTATLYVDGVGESFARTNTIKQTSQDIFIGNIREDTTSWFDGHIDSIRLFSRCLDGDEVFKLYAEVLN